MPDHLLAAAGPVLAAVPGMPEWLSAERLAAAGIVVLMLVIFAETGLLVGFFLPGDSLLFTVGLLVSQDKISYPLWLCCLVLFVAAILGNACGYAIGAAAGPRVFERQDSRLFKKKYVDQTAAFFDKYGNRAIVLARFVPVVRTFITVLAGVAGMEFRRFMTYSAIGGALWAFGVTALGYYLGQIAFVRTNIEAMLLAIVLVSVLPVFVEILRARAAAKFEHGHHHE